MITILINYYKAGFGLPFVSGLLVVQRLLIVYCEGGGTRSDLHQCPFFSRENFGLSVCVCLSSLFLLSRVNVEAVKCLYRYRAILARFRFKQNSESRFSL